ncbi:hypothetical protein JOF53_006176 [Crossiella equi]|uniref:ParB-like N-terminal domain-containing protein n=1 Tax=Crossiella equi TaxID=130796 RepID=A0ABS5AL58_9PSEU|nr:winged helix-turn-helix transcriptional regulator [Crossiella equi]MBP2477304.1 hypothetical protein [Crossiella equi]
MSGDEAGDAEGDRGGAGPADWWSRQLTGRVETVEISELLPADSPRLAGEVDEHARVLAGAGTPLPPITVHRPSMRVIDGMHRLRAARLRGQRQIQVRYYDGDADSAYILGVHANIAHGMPLSLADRTAAAARIVYRRPEWSDRMIAEATGLAPRTVGAIRRRSTVQNAWSNARVGRDGKVRPVNSTPGRLLAGALLADNPRASLREVARVAGLSPSTVRDVRRRLSSGLDPVPAGRHGNGPGRTVDGRFNPVAALNTLKHDPALRFTESGRTLLRWLDAHAPDASGWAELAENVPAHCGDIVAALARSTAAAWYGFAERVERRKCSSA